MVSQTHFNNLENIYFSHTKKKNHQKYQVWLHFCPAHIQQNSDWSDVYYNGINNFNSNNSVDKLAKVSKKSYVVTKSVENKESVILLSFWTVGGGLGSCEPGLG